MFCVRSQRLPTNFALNWGDSACGRNSCKEFALRAIISDIHANLEALEAVLADIKQQGITEIYCLGDIIGYGPNPNECIDRVTKSSS